MGKQNLLKLTFTLIVALVSINTFGQIALKKQNLTKIKASMLIPSDAEVKPRAESDGSYSYTIESEDIDIELGTISASDGTNAEVLAELKEFAVELGISPNLKSTVSNNTKVYYSSGIVYDEDYGDDMLKMIMFFQSQVKNHRVAMIIETYEINKDIKDAISKIADSFVLTDNEGFNYEMQPSKATAASAKTATTAVASAAPAQKQSVVKDVLSSELFKSVVSVAQESLAKKNNNKTGNKLASALLGFFNK